MTSVWSKMRNSSGLTLVELLVAVAIGLILLGGIYQVFVSSTSAYSRNENMSRLQENSRFVAQTLKNTIAAAGFLGCSQDLTSFENILNNPADFAVNYALPVEGLEWDNVGSEWQDVTGTAVDPATLVGLALTDALADSDILAVRHVNFGQTLDLLGGMATANGTINVGPGLNFTAGTNLLIADCEVSSQFRINAYDNVTGLITHVGANASANLQRAYTQDAQIFFPQTVAFYIRNNPALVPSLYRRATGAAAPEELVEGVETMQVRYGIDDPAISGNVRAQEVTSYEEANNVTDWDRVLSVRIGLLLQAPNDNLRATAVNRVYNVNGVNINRADRRSRTVVNMTIGLRNRLR